MTSRRPIRPSAMAASGSALPIANDDEAVFEACQDPEIQRWVPVPVPYGRETRP
jgi:hypothetical protein